MLPGYGIVYLALLGSLPLTLPMAALYDGLRRRRGASLRFLAFLVGYLSCELAGVVACFGIWLPFALGIVSRERFLAWNFALQRAWAVALLGIARRLYRLQLEIEGESCAKPGPLLVFARHASLIDTLLPAALLSARQGLRLRYVLKRALLLDPCLDVVGQRLPNVFVRRDGVDSAREIRSVRALARALGPDEGILLYPEGTRFTPAKRRRALLRLSESRQPDLAVRAAKLERVLPPRLGGSLALLDACAGIDLLLLGHVGLEGLTRPRHLWDGALLDRTVRIRFWRIAASEIPADEPGRVAWLYTTWERLDRWIAAQPS